MMSTVAIEEAQAKLPEIIDKLAPGEELIIMRNQQPVAKLVGQKRPVGRPRQPGSAKGTLVALAEDDEHPEDFKEYMPCGTVARRDGYPADRSAPPLRNP